MEIVSKSREQSERVRDAMVEIARIKKLIDAHVAEHGADAVSRSKTRMIRRINRLQGELDLWAAEEETAFTYIFMSTAGPDPDGD